MAKKIPPKRKYDSSRRKEQSRQTRLQISKAAHRLFIKHGYTGTTIDAIAQEAGVAQKTVYAIFGSKHKILAFLLDISLGGDDQPVSLLERPEPQAVLHDTDQNRQLAMFAQGITEIVSRAAPVFEIMRSAAKTESEIASLLHNLYQERLNNMRTFVQHVAANGPLRSGLDEAYASEIVWAITSPEVFQLLTTQHDWPKEKYSHWLADTLTRLLLP
jgi:TetR/AcrR family transcriptional regulator of autoinduction and epiphytic fitness